MSSDTLITLSFWGYFLTGAGIGHLAVGHILHSARNKDTPFNLPRELKILLEIRPELLLGGIYLACTLFWLPLLVAGAIVPKER